MPDYFALLGQERRPWLDPDSVKEAFHRRSAELHPDVSGTGDAAKFAELNTAYTTLREVPTRLRHLLELTAPECLAVNAPPPAELGDLFMRFGGWQQRAGKLAAKQSAIMSPLALALLAGEESLVRRDLEAIETAIEGAIHTAQDQVRAKDHAVTGADAAEIAAAYTTFAYLTRWQHQAREARLHWER